MAITRYILVLFTLLLFVPLGCFARREKVGLSVDQSIYSFNLYPGEEQEFVLKIKNIVNEKQRVKAETKDFSVDDDNKTSFLAGKNEIHGMKDWITVDGENIWLMEPGEERLVKCTLKAPEDASVGSHFSAVLFSALPEVDFDNFQKQIVGGGIGTYVFLNIGGEIIGDGSIENFISPKVVGREADFQVAFENRGNVHYIPHGEIRIRNVFSGRRFDNELSKHFVFPGKSYSFEHRWQVPSIFGVYTAEAFFVDQAGRNLSEKRMLWGKGFLIVAIIVVTMMATIFIVWRKRKRRKVVEADLV